MRLGSKKLHADQTRALREGSQHSVSAIVETDQESLVQAKNKLSIITAFTSNTIAIRHHQRQNCQLKRQAMTISLFIPISYIALAQRHM